MVAKLRGNDNLHLLDAESKLIAQDEGHKHRQWQEVFAGRQKREELFSGQAGNTELEFSAEIGHPCTQNKVAQYRSSRQFFAIFK